MDSPSPDGVVTITCDFVRQRSVLLTHGDLRPLFERWHRHYDTHGLDIAPELANAFESGLAAFVLHLAGQSRNRHVTWTINPGSPRANFFFGGSTYDGSVTGRVFTENVAEFTSGQFYQESIVAGKGPFRSFATFTGSDLLDAVAQYYATSEQRPAKIFHLGECRFAMAHAHPDYDEGWFTTLDAEKVAKIFTDEELGRIETRSFGWQCGCEEAGRIPGALLPAYKSDPAGLFGDSDSIEVRCPRCAAGHTITRAAMQQRLEYERLRDAGKNAPESPKN